MHNRIRKLSFVTVALSFVFVGACSGGGAPAVDDSPEGQLFLFRDGVMQVIGWKVAHLRDMADGVVPADDEVFARSAREIAALTGMVTEGFPPGSMVPASRARPEIWERWDDFERQSAGMQRAADELVTVAESGGVAASDNALRALAQTCGNCHRAYRAVTE